MNEELKKLAESFLNGDSTDAGFLSECLASAAAATADATLDMDRQRRCGYPEVVFGEGKFFHIALKGIFRFCYIGFNHIVKGLKYVP